MGYFVKCFGNSLAGQLDILIGLKSHLNNASVREMQRAVAREELY